MMPPPPSAGSEVESMVHSDLSSASNMKRKNRHDTDDPGYGVPKSKARFDDNENAKEVMEQVIRLAGLEVNFISSAVRFAGADIVCRVTMMKPSPQKRW